VERDSAATGTIAMPVTLQGAARLRLNDRLALMASATSRSWSRADAGVVDLGGVGARNTTAFAAGAEWIRNVRTPEHLPVRIGVRRATLPFLVLDGEPPRETAFALGTGIRFAGGTGGIDLALERITRSQGDALTETAWQFSLGVSLRGPAALR
jgi:hypothetical protein